MVKYLHAGVYVGVAGVAAVLCAESAVAQPSQSQFFSNAQISPQTIDLGNTMNFDDCLEFNFSLCAQFNPLCPVGPKLKYREPIALVETTCLKGRSLFVDELSSVSNALTGGLGVELDKQKCFAPNSRPGGKQTYNYYDVHVFGISPLARYQSSASPGQATKSLACAMMSMGLRPSVTGQFEDLTAIEDIATNVPPEELESAIRNANLSNTLGLLPGDGKLGPYLSDSGADFISRGASLGGGAISKNSLDSMTSALLDVGRRAQDYASLVSSTSDSTFLCGAQKVLADAQQGVTAMGAVLNDNSIAKPKPFAATTYPIAQGLDEKIYDGVPNPACPLTSAGYIPTPKAGTVDGFERHSSNCSNIDRGYGVAPDGSYSTDSSLCDSNALSTYTVNLNGQDYYPACNGYYYTSGGTLKYDASKDHTKILNEGLVAQSVSAQSQSGQKVMSAMQSVTSKINSLGGQCDAASGKPLGSWGTPLPSNTPFSVSGGANTGASNSGLTVQDVVQQQSFGLQEVVRLVNRFDAAMRAGGWSNTVGAYMGRFTPWGLNLAFASENTDWMKPSLSVSSMLTQQINQLVNYSGSMAYMVCAGGALQSDLQQLGINFLNSVNASQLNNILGCVGVWGPERPATGWYFGNNEARGAMLASYRALQVPQRLGIIAKHKNGPGWFNYDNPIHAKSDFGMALGVSGSGQGGSFKGSKCYEPGTAEPFYNAAERTEAAQQSGFISLLSSGGLNANAPATTGTGHHVSTWWKGTKCCMYLPCGKFKWLDYD